ncbi:MAG TPA: alpha/beta fold hydrolase [Thermohalobaculum sp.]|nr:alpha/beta fold hydrolase [Thermohalobaculum sp.]
MAVELPHLDYPAEERSDEPPLLMAHGLFGSARNFHTIAGKLAARRRVIAVDMRSHGSAPWGEAGYEAMAADLAHAVERLAGGRARVLGHSMGGKAAMGLALSRPELVDALVVADIAPLTYRHSHIETIRGMQAVDLDRVRRRSDAEQALAEAVPEKQLRLFLLQNLVIEDGRARWRIDLEGLGEGMDRLIGWPGDWPRDSYDGPTLFLHGGASDYVPPESHPRIRGLFPHAEIEAIDGAGHFLHAEKPAEFTDAVDRWLSAL